MIPANPQELVKELGPLMAIFPGRATPGWMGKIAVMIWLLETTGAPRFGGPDVLAWWLVQRCQPRVPLTKAKIRQLQRMCGKSQKTLDLLVAMAEDRSKPNRLGRGWSFLHVNSYLTMLRAERLAS
jgi:hypothetical protein